MAPFLMWTIYTQHQESKPTITLMFSPLKCVPLSPNAYRVATLAWAVAHPILGQPWSKLIELLPASVFYAILWQRAYDDLLFRARRLRFLDSQLASRVGLLFLLPGVRLALLAMVAHAVTNVLAVILWESAASF